MNQISYRKLLVPLTGRAHESAAVEGAMRVAKRFNSHVVGLFAHADPFDEVAYSAIDGTGVLMGDILERAKKSAQNIAEKARIQFASIAQAEGIELAPAAGGAAAPTGEFVAVRGNAIHVIEDESRLSDMVVFCSGRDADKSKMRELLDTVLVGGSAPVLYFPDGCSREIGGRVAVGYDGSAAAAHSVRAALPFLAKADSLHLMGLAGPRGEPQKHLAQLQNYLALRGIQADGTSHGTTDTAKHLIDAARANQCNLLVAGGYGQKTMREWFMGGVADEFLDRNSSMALLMAH